MIHTVNSITDHLRDLSTEWAYLSGLSARAAIAWSRSVNLPLSKRTQHLRERRYRSLNRKFTLLTAKLLAQLLGPPPSHTSLRSAHRRSGRVESTPTQ